MITRSGWAVLIGSPLLYVVGVLLGYHPLLAVAIAGFVVFALAWPWLLNRVPLEVRRQLEPTRVTVGEVAYGELTVRNTSRHRVPPQQAVDHIGGDPVRVPLPTLRAGAEKVARYRLPSERRGVVDVGPLAVVRGDPFGLIRLDRRHGDVRSLWVHPRRHRLTALPPTLSRSFEGQTTDSAPRGTMTFHAVREYVHGDELRHIHWPATAHTGELMVREHIDTSQPDLTVVLDLRADVHDADSFEHAVEVAASLLEATVDHGFVARLATTGGGVTEVGAGAHDATVLLDALAAVERGGAGDLWAVDRLLSQAPRGHAGVIVTGSVGTEDAVAIRALRPRFVGCATVALGGPPAGLVPGAVIVVDSAAAFARAWNSGQGL